MGIGAANERQRYKLVGKTFGLAKILLQVNIISQWLSPYPEQSLHFTNSISKCIFMKETLDILIQISLKFLFCGPFEN